MKSDINNRGFSHHLILPILAIFAVGAIGVATLNLSSAASTTKSCTKVTFGRYKNNPAYSKYAKYKSCVKAIQKKVGSSQDGVYGNNTQSRVKAWQKNHGLTADGVVGKNTWAAMGIHPTYKVEVSSTKRYSYQKCTYRYYTKAYVVSYGIPPKVKCSVKTTTNRAIAENVVDTNGAMFEKRNAHVKLYNNWIEKRSGGDQKGAKASQQSIKDTLKIDLIK